ncbi:MAG TPA: hypothetical protein VHV74_23490 [Pseudonocardiaceae bacterium]|jgi:hypothetical protein|nr:hypothetical protein [Pseudonocardiaceae bacterium]
MADEGNPLVTTVDTGSWGGTANIASPVHEEGPDKGSVDYAGISKDTEGAGLFSDAASTMGDIASHNWGGLAVDAVGDGMDALGMAMDPLGSLAGAGIGWLIEHIGFLKKPLDLLAGDPDAVTAKAQTWTNVSKALSDAADQYKQSTQTLQGANQGDAVNGATKTGDNLSTVLQGASQQADSAAGAMRGAATVVGTTRGVIRDSLSQFVADAIIKWIAATATAWFTFGATEAAFVVDEVAEGTSLAVQDASKLTQVLNILKRFAGDAKESESTLKNATEDLDRGARNTDSIARDAGDGGAATSEHGPTKPSDTSEGTTPSSADDGGATVTDHGQTKPTDTSEGTTPSSADDGGATMTDHGDTAPSDTSETTTPSSADAGGAPTTTEHGETAPSGDGEGGAGGGETPSSSSTPKKQHYWQKEEEGPSREELQQSIAKNKQDVAGHNQKVADHNADARELANDRTVHQQKTDANDAALAQNKHTRDMNQQAINRARAQGKNHDSLNAQHRELESQHKSLSQEKENLAGQKDQLDQRQGDLHQRGTDLNNAAKDLNKQQTTLLGHQVKDVSHRVGLEGSENPVVKKLETVHKIWEGPGDSQLGDKIKEPFAQGLSDQHTRNDGVAYESGVQQQEWAEEHEKEPEPAGSGEKQD